MMNYRDIITIDPEKCGGRPCIRGMRITVYDVLEYLASDMTEEEVLQDFPYLTHEDIKACLQYAANRESHLMVIMDNQKISPMKMAINVNETTSGSKSVSASGH